MKHYPDLSKNNYEIIGELGRNREGGRVSYLESFLAIYQRDDGWRQNAITVLERFSRQ